MKKKILLTILVTLIGMPLGSYSADNATTNINQAVEKEKKPLYWIDTMEPDVHYSAPGKSRMGMDLVPIYSDTKKSNDKTGASQ
jgi:Cu(I)/Ag(I) efflux system membrane fusion protein